MFLFFTVEKNKKNFESVVSSLGKGHSPVDRLWVIERVVSDNILWHSSKSDHSLSLSKSKLVPKKWIIIILNFILRFKKLKLSSPFRERDILLLKHPHVSNWRNGVAPKLQACVRGYKSSPPPKDLRISLELYFS